MCNTSKNSRTDSLFRFARHVFATKQDQNYDCEPRYSKQIPVPDASDQDRKRLHDLGAKCAETAAGDDPASVAICEAEIDRIVYRLFDLTAAEIRLIESALS